MANPHVIGPLVRRFLLEEVGIERNLSIHTQRSYRDTLRLLFHFLAERYATEPTQVTVEHLTVDVIKHFLIYLEEERGNTIDTRNLRKCVVARPWRLVMAAPRGLGRRVARGKSGSGRYQTADHASESREKNGCGWPD